jgi:uncharacterized protein YqgV (UPF0045/DUF77 family)
MQCQRLPEAHLSHYPQPTTRLYKETHTVKLTAELSLYPLQEDYIPVMQAFIRTASTDNNLTIVTNAMSTQVCGECDQVFAMVQQALETSYQQYGKQVLVCKFIPGELDIQ